MTDKPASDTPRTDALVSKHSDEHVSMYAAGNWRHEDAVRQAGELLNHARQLECELATERAARAAAEEFIAKAFDAYPNLDLDIQALTTPGSQP